MTSAMRRLSRSVLVLKLSLNRGLGPGHPGRGSRAVEQLARQLRVKEYVSTLRCMPSVSGEQAGCRFRRALHRYLIMESRSMAWAIASRASRFFKIGFRG